MAKIDAVISAAESQLGSPYVYGTWGQPCTTALRKRYAGYNPDQQAITYKRCPVLSGKQSSCSGCKYQGRLAFDCRGFSHYCLGKAGIEITGGYVARQWSDANWADKGEIGSMPDLVCCVFVRKSNGSWSHTGLHIGGGRIIHCSGEVKRDTVTGSDCKWSHYAVPKGLYTADEIKNAHKIGGFIRMLKKGSKGDDVRELQIMLNALGYDCGTADGVFGAKTQAAVKAFQLAEGLTPDGIAGPQTLEILAARNADPDQPELPDDDDEFDVPANMVILTHEESTAIIAALKKAIAIIEKAMK